MLRSQKEGKTDILAVSDSSTAEKLSSIMHNVEPEGLVLFSLDLITHDLYCLPEHSYVQSWIKLFWHVYCCKDKKSQTQKKKIKPCNMTTGSKGNSTTVYLQELCISKTVSTFLSPWGHPRMLSAACTSPMTTTDESWVLMMDKISTAWPLAALGMEWICSFDRVISPRLERRGFAVWHLGSRKLKIQLPKSSSFLTKDQYFVCRL